MKSKNIKVCHIATVHPSNDIRITMKQIKSLSKSYKMTLLTSDDYSRRYQYLDYIEVKKHSNRIERILRSRSEIKKKLKDQKFDIFHIHEPELLPLVPFLKRKGAKIIYDSHEDTAKQIESKYYIPKFFRSTISIFFSFYETFMLKKVDGVIGATPIIKNKLIKVNKNTIDIKNYPILDEFKEMDLNITRKKNQVIYIGGLSEERGLFEMINIAKLTPEVTYVFCGSFTNSHDQSKALNIKPKNCIFRGQLDREDILKELSASKIGLILLENNQRFRESLPIKLFEYMAAGLTIISSDFPEWKNLIDENDIGYQVNPQKYEEIANLIKDIIYNEESLRDVQVKARKKVFSLYNWENEEKKLLQFYNLI